MNKGFGSMVNRIILAVGLLLVLGCQACEEKKLAEPAPGKALESTTPAPPVADRREASTGSESAAEGSSREGTPVGGSK